MSISIMSCPKCGTFLLSDTAQCHRCKFVIHPERANQYRDSSLPTDAAIQQDMERCRQCGEACRKGLVRCWSCGAFTRPEIEAAYYRLLQGHDRQESRGQRYELPEISLQEARKTFWVEEDRQQGIKHAAQTAEYTALDDDFELTGNFSLLEGAANPGNLTTGSPPLAAATTDAPSANDSPSSSAASPASTPAPATASKASEPVGPPPDDADSLLSIAKQQETDVQKSRRAKFGEGFVIYCPMGCKIRVQERHRGKIGRCPKCQATFVVPMARQTAVSGMVPASAAGMGGAITTAAASGAGSKYSRWLQNVHLHKVVPQKLRIKADSLLKDFQEVDLGFDPSGLLLISLSTGGGMFGGKNAKKADAARAAIAEHLSTKGTIEDCPAGFKQEFAPETVSQISLSQPAPAGSDSLFGDIPVFGAGRIAIRLPKFDDKTTAYLSFSLSEFREFSRSLAEYFGIESFGTGCGIPLQDEYEISPCHFSKQPVKTLRHLVYYQKDPAFKLEISGYRCKVCQTVISEAARAGQKLGGANGKGIAKAKCPKCTKPMGNQALYQVPPAEKPAASEDKSPAPDAAFPSPEPASV